MSEIPNKDLAAAHEAIGGETLADGPGPLQLAILRSQELDVCPFWVGLYKKGAASPRDLFSLPTSADILALLSEVGLREDQPLMLSHNAPDLSPRQFYLLPEARCRGDIEAVRELLVTTVEALRPPQIGLYFAPDRLGAAQATHLLEEVTLGLAFLRSKEIYLYTGKQGVNNLLNAALRIKQRLEGHREIFVYH